MDGQNLSLVQQCFIELRITRILRYLKVIELELNEIEKEFKNENNCHFSMPDSSNVAG